MRIAITGATGLIGRALAERLIERGDEVVALTRSPERARDSLPEGAEAAAWAVGDVSGTLRAIEGTDAVVHLAGAPIFAKRWKKAVKEDLLRSRVEGTRTVVDAMAAAENPPRVLLNASAIGFYGPREDEEVDEGGTAGDDFLASICIEWEDEARKAAAVGARVVLLRIGIVLAAEGGALEKMLPPIKAFVGGKIGSGRQAMSWVHVDDAVGITLLALDRPELSGPVNVTAPNPLSNRDFTKAVAKAVRRPAWLPMPGFALRIVLGEAAGVLTTGQRVVPKKALEAGYEFRFREAAQALADLLGQ